MVRGILTVLGTFALAGCLSARSRLLNIKPGMSREDVISFMGEPGDSRTKGGQEALQWCATRGMTSQYVVVRLRDGRVSGTNAYKAAGAGVCSDNFQDINWDGPPATQPQLQPE